MKKFTLSLFITVSLAACGAGDDNGNCTILVNGTDPVFEDISIEACQDKFGETRGAFGWKWEPNN